VGGARLVRGCTYYILHNENLVSLVTEILIVFKLLHLPKTIVKSRNFIGQIQDSVQITNEAILAIFRNLLQLTDFYDPSSGPRSSRLAAQDGYWQSVKKYISSLTPTQPYSPPVYLQVSPWSGHVYDSQCEGFIPS
jgi:hypothetical protein